MGVSAGVKSVVGLVCVATDSGVMIKDVTGLEVFLLV